MAAKSICVQVLDKELASMSQFAFLLARTQTFLKIKMLDFKVLVKTKFCYTNHYE